MPPDRAAPHHGFQRTHQRRADVRVHAWHHLVPQPRAPHPGVSLDAHQHHEPRAVARVEPRAELLLGPGLHHLLPRAVRAPQVGVRRHPRPPSPRANHAPRAHCPQRRALRGELLAGHHDGLSPLLYRRGGVMQPHTRHNDLHLVGGGVLHVVDADAPPPEVREENGAAVEVPCEEGHSLRPQGVVFGLLRRCSFAQRRLLAPVCP
mmetsp:Transcript_38255/g.95067  ORF Transcript_38255/g.95067 Transcript_38255/m.95067 type:complete len:206 (+) Transcript_38255:1423-2040(+)